MSLAMRIGAGPVEPPVSPPKVVRQRRTRPRLLGLAVLLIALGGHGAGAAPTQPAAQLPRNSPPAAEVPAGEEPAVTVGAARVGEPDQVNRALAVSAVLAVSSIVGAQIGAVLGLARRAATAGTAGTAGTARTGVGGPAARAHATVRELPAGRHRRD